MRALLETRIVFAEEFSKDHIENMHIGAEVEETARVSKRIYRGGDNVYVGLGRVDLHDHICGKEPYNKEPCKLVFGLGSSYFS